MKRTNGHSKGEKGEEENEQQSTDPFLPSEVNLDIKTRQDAINFVKNKEKEGKSVRWTAIELGNFQLALTYVVTDTRRHKKGRFQIVARCAIIYVVLTPHQRG